MLPLRSGRVSCEHLLGGRACSRSGSCLTARGRGSIRRPASWGGCGAASTGPLQRAQHAPVAHEGVRAEASLQVPNLDRPVCAGSGDVAAGRRQVCVRACVCDCVNITLCCGMCICAPIIVCMIVHVRACVRTCAHACLCMYLSAHNHMRVGFACVCECVCACVFVCVCVLTHARFFV